MALWSRSMAAVSRSIVRSIASSSLRYGENAAAAAVASAPDEPEADSVVNPARGRSKPSKDQRRQIKKKLKQRAALPPEAREKEPFPPPRDDGLMRHRMRGILIKAAKNDTTFDEAISLYDGDFTMHGFERALAGILPKFAIEFFNWGKTQEGFVFKPRLIYCVMDALRRGGDLNERGRSFVEEFAGDEEAQRIAYSGLYQHLLVAEDEEQAEKVREEMKSRGIELHPSVFGRLQELKFKSDGLDASVELCREHLAQGFVPDGDGLNPMISRLCVAGRAEEAYKIFLETSERGSWHPENSHFVLVNYLTKLDKVDEGFKVAEMLFKLGMVSKDTPMRPLINKLAQVKKYDEAFTVLKEVSKVRGSSEGVHLVKLLCFDKELDYALRVVKEVGKIEVDDQKVLLLKLCKAKRLDDARFVFNSMVAAGAKPDAEVCTALALLQQDMNSA